MVIHDTDLDRMAAEPNLVTDDEVQRMVLTIRYLKRMVDYFRRPPPSHGEGEAWAKAEFKNFDLRTDLGLD